MGSNVHLTFTCMRGTTTRFLRLSFFSPYFVWSSLGKRKVESHHSVSGSAGVRWWKFEFVPTFPTLTPSFYRLVIQGEPSLAAKAGVGFVAVYCKDR